MATNYGISITAKEKDSRHPGLFISGMSWQAGKFRVIIPLRLGDFVPVWETEQEAVAVIGKFKASVAGNDSISSPWKSPPAFSQAGR